MPSRVADDAFAAAFTHPPCGEGRPAEALAKPGRGGSSATKINDPDPGSLSLAATLPARGRVRKEGTSTPDHPLIDKGMTAQLATRRARIAAGEKPLGWKVGFGAPASMQRLGLQAPLIGYLMQRALIPSGGAVSLKGWAKPVAEPEIAVRMGRDLAANAAPGAVMAAIDSLRPAIELADLDPPPEPGNLDAVLAGDIYQRHVVLAEQTRAGGSVEGLTSRLIRRGAEANRTSDPEALTGKLLAIVAHVATTLAAFGETLSAGDIVITGSITPPLMLEGDETELVHAIDPIGAASVRFARE